MTTSSLLTEFPAYKAIKSHAARLKTADIAQFFRDDERRSDDFTLQAAGLQLDYSKHLLDRTALSSLFDLAAQADLTQHIASMLTGAHVNVTEDRAALHSLLRASAGDNLVEKFEAVSATRERMRACVDALKSGRHTGYSGGAITDVVNIGIGGSDLGPRMVTQALTPYHGAPSCHYVANVDPADLQDTLRHLQPATTLFIICSKSFRTEETRTNSLGARTWLLQSGAAVDDLHKHFIAVTGNLQAAADFGIPADNCLPLWDWVGGRYSVWSAVGLSCAIAVGWNNFKQFLAGAEAMDEHFRDSAAPGNMPLLMALLEVWYGNFHGAGNHVVLPYHQHLQHFPDYLQQLTMESNGKRVSSAGTALSYATAPILWGSAGTMGQHSFHQLLHQGTALCPADFVLPLTTHTGMTEQHQKLVANCLAQSRTLMVGRSLEKCEAALTARGHNNKTAAALAPHLVLPGNRPSSIITMEALNPATLGALLALYEHRTFCSSRLWGINPFDQWGVELGKEIGTEILARLSDAEADNRMDAATERLITAWRNAQS